MGTRHCKLTSSFTSTTNHMISAPFCQNAERIFTPARPLLDLSGFSCLVIRRLKHLLLLFCVCVCVCVHPAVTKFITLGMDPALHYTSVDNICREGKKKIINDLIFEICGKGRIWVTSLFSFFFGFLFSSSLQPLYKSWRFPKTHLSIWELLISCAESTRLCVRALQTVYASDWSM